MILFLSIPASCVRAVTKVGLSSVEEVPSGGVGLATQSAFVSDKIKRLDQRQLFKAFHRGGNVGSRPGTGLGLLQVKRSAELHGGQVPLESKIGEGTTVTVTIPVFSSEF